MGCHFLLFQGVSLIFYSCPLPLLSLPNGYRHKIYYLLEMGNGQREKYEGKSVKASKCYSVHMYWGTSSQLSKTKPVEHLEADHLLLSCAYSQTGSEYHLMCVQITQVSCSVGWWDLRFCIFHEICWWLEDPTLSGKGPL